MKIQKIASLFLCAVMLVISVSCGNADLTPAVTTAAPETDTTTVATTTEATTAATTTEATTVATTTEATTAATTTAKPEATTTEVTTSTAPAVEPTVGEPLTSAPPKSLKVLAIGNSFSTDCMQYLYQIAKDGGVEEIVLGNLYYGGCSLQQHLGFATADAPEYTYYKNTTGTWSSTKNYKMSSAIADEDWDFITLQQTSKTCGLTSSYGETLTKLVDYVRTKNSKATLIWNATWAYQQDSTHSSFPNYGKDQGKMYDMIIDCVKQCILPEERFELVIPCMTSIQNARTSFIGDKLTRDGYHMDYNIGRYIVGLTWYAALTNAPIEGITYNPSTTQITADMMKVAKEAVTNAIKHPLAVTQSAITTGELPKGAEPIDPSVVLNPVDFFEADSAVAAANGVDLSKYTLLEWNYLENTYWNCTSKAGTTTPKSTASTYHQNVCTDKKYSLTELPVGTVFVLDTGWQYRLELYTDPDAKYTGTRPAMTTAQFNVLTKEFVGDGKYIAWNISSNPKTDISAIYAQAACHLRVYVPQAKPEEPLVPMHFTQEDVCESPSLTSYAKFAKCSTEAFVVPGLNQSIVPQGMDYWAEKNWMLISGYCTDSALANGKGSVLFAVDMTSGAMVGEFYLKNMNGTYYTGHAGGVAITEKNVYISDGSKLRRIPLSVLSKVGRSGDVTFVEEISVPVRASFCNVSGGILWVGDFQYGTSYPTDEFRHMTNRAGTTYYAWAVGYELDPSTENELKPSAKVKGSYATPDRILSITDRIQGMAYLPEVGQIALSQSYGRTNNSTLYFYDDPMADAAHANVTLNGVSVPVWFLDGKLKNKTMPALPMSEGLANVNGVLYVLFESGANKYRLDRGKLPTDMVYAVDITKY